MSSSRDQHVGTERVIGMREVVVLLDHDVFGLLYGPAWRVQDCQDDLRDRLADALEGVQGTAEVELVVRIKGDAP